MVFRHSRNVTTGETFLVVKGGSVQVIVPHMSFMGKTLFVMTLRLDPFFRNDTGTP